MHAPAPTSQPGLKGWRARLWAWVLFAALLKGLIPHAALAAVLMHGDPAALLCAPGASAGKTGAQASVAQGSTHAPCVCAAMGDGALPPACAPVLRVAGAQRVEVPAPALSLARIPAHLPPARGPPAST